MSGGSSESIFSHALICFEVSSFRETNESNLIARYIHMYWKEEINYFVKIEFVEKNTF